MKKSFLILLIFMMFNCDAEDIADIGSQLTKNERYQVGLSAVCSDTSSKTWYCISKAEYDRLAALSRSCDIITITSSSDNKYTGIITSDNSFRKSESPCFN
ncbi:MULTISPECIES: hypothetical protein [Aestuariivivens]|uniref:hypothetical protein n=1 Tax=Aestuariivivens TaxID=1820275 RepID=UPI001CBF833B|nr:MULTISPECIES: hypothetical protein [Aestuariivivens]